MDNSAPAPSLPLKIGTRSSPLALAQANEVKRQLMATHGLPENLFEIVKIQTAGDQITNRSLAEIGGKGLFVTEIEEKLLKNEIDIAVHSLKDMPIVQPDGLVLGTMLAREDPRDALISPRHKTLLALPKGARVGTSSTRRRAQLLNLRPDLEIIDFRGNVGTRLKKLQAGHASATLLAIAGLNRLNRLTPLEAHIKNTSPPHPIDPEIMLPAPGQGIICIERRTTDAAIAEFLAPLSDPDTIRCARAERAFLRMLDGSCSTPIAALASIKGEQIILSGEILSLDGLCKARALVKGPKDDGVLLGEKLAENLLAKNILVRDLS